MREEGSELGAEPGWIVRERDLDAAVDAVGPQGETALRVVVKLDRPSRLDCSHVPGNRVARQPVRPGPCQVAPRRALGADRQHVAGRVVAEERLRAGGRDGEGDVGAVAHAPVPVVLVPALVDGGFDLVASGRQGAGGEAVAPVALRILQPGTQARGPPVVDAPEEVLIAAGRGDDRGVAAARHPVRLVVVVELDRPGLRQRERDVGAVTGGVGAVVLGPSVVQGGLVFPAPRGDVEAPLPYAVIGVEAEMRGIATGLPVCRAAHLRLEAARDRDARRLRSRPGRGHAQDVAGRIVGEHHLRAGGGDGEWNVGSVARTARAVVLVPALANGGLDLVAARGKSGGKAVDPIAVEVLQPRPQARRVPIARAAEQVLVAAGGGSDDRPAVVGDPMRVVAVVEPDRGRLAERQGDVGSVARRVGAVVLVPTVVEGRLVLPVPGGDVEGRPPHSAGGVGQVRRGAVGLPVPRAAQLGLEASRDRDRARRRRVGGASRHGPQEHEREGRGAGSSRGRRRENGGHHGGLLLPCAPGRETMNPC